MQNRNSWETAERLSWLGAVWGLESCGLMGWFVAISSISQSEKVETSHSLAREFSLFMFGQGCVE